MSERLPQRQMSPEPPPLSGTQRREEAVVRQLRRDVVVQTATELSVSLSVSLSLCSFGLGFTSTITFDRCCVIPYPTFIGISVLNDDQSTPLYRKDESWLRIIENSYENPVSECHLSRSTIFARVVECTLDISGLGNV
jgi:hypothetical protein